MNMCRRLSCFVLILFFTSCTCYDRQTELLPPLSLSRQYQIIDAHEHIKSRADAYKYLKAMDEQNVQAMMLVASPQDVLDSANVEIFGDPEGNNEELLAIVRKHPDRFYAFATFRPDDKDMLAKLKRFLDAGGTGLKLYNGHVNYYDKFAIRLDAPHMLEVFAFCEKNSVPVIFHANARFYWDELKNILDAYPELIVNLPHYCMALIEPERMREIFERYPNTYSDISLGYYEFAYPALEYISERWQAYRDFVREYKDRFLFAADMVLTDAEATDTEYVALMIDGYRDFLEKKHYTNIVIDEYLVGRDLSKTKRNGYFYGLALDADTLSYIYEYNPKRFLGLGR